METNQEESQGHPIITMATLLIPISVFILFGVTAYKANKRQKEYIKRRNQHMDRVEAQSDEIIGLLKEIRNRNQK